VVSRKLTPFHGADGADALQGIGQQCPSDRGNDDRWRLGGLRSLVAAIGEGCIVQHGADGADALQGIGQQCPSGCGNDDRWRLGGFEVRGLGFGVLNSEFYSVFCILPSRAIQFRPGNISPAAILFTNLARTHSLGCAARDHPFGHGLFLRSD
jgi:hypothetical protein